MSEVNRYTATRLKFEGGEVVCSVDAPIEVVPAFDYDALAQQLAASEAEVVKLNEAAAFMDNVSHGIEDGLRAQLAARDKRLGDAVGLLRCAPWANWTWWARDTRAFLSQADEAKEND